MRSKSLKSLFTACTIAGLMVLVSASCSSKKAKTEEPPAAATGEQTPTTVDKDITTDAQGSDSGKIAGLSTVYFDYDQAKLSGETRKKLASNADWIKAHPNFTIQVEGHTDARGSVEYNLALGERRAKSVKSYLESLGIEAKRITIISYG